MFCRSMISWGVIAEILTPRYWLTWLWTSDRRRADEVTPTTYLIDRRRSRDDKAYLITGDRCYECNRFLSWHSDNNGYCSYHNVKWASPEGRFYFLFQSFSLKAAIIFVGLFLADEQIPKRGFRCKSSLLDEH